MLTTTRARASVWNRTPFQNAVFKLSQSVHPVLLEHLDGHVARITLNRPNARNAVNGDLANSLERAIRDTETNTEVRVVVLTGAGRGFCAGADLAEVAAGREAALWTESGGFAGFVKS